MSDDPDILMCIHTEFVIDADYHGESRAERNNSSDGVGPGPLPMLYLHPTVHIVP